MLKDGISQSRHAFMSHPVDRLHILFVLNNYPLGIVLHLPHNREPLSYFILKGCLNNHKLMTTVVFWLDMTHIDQQLFRY